MRHKDQLRRTGRSKSDLLSLVERKGQLKWKNNPQGITLIRSGMVFEPLLSRGTDSGSEMQIQRKQLIEAVRTNFLVIWLISLGSK